MSLFVQRVFAGEVPRLPADLVPENHAQEARNVDVAHGELRGLRGPVIMATSLKYQQRPIKSAYTEDGVNFFAWADDTSVVKSQVVNDVHFRIYYTTLYPLDNIIKVARTQRNDNGALTPVIGSALVGGNWMPPEASAGPDSWVLGVPVPRVQADIIEDNHGATLIDAAQWPSLPYLALRVTYFLENAQGEIVAQQDVSNSETALDPNTGLATTNVFWTNNSDDRGTLIQDMLWPLGYTRRPYKYYFFAPPDLTAQAVGRTVTVNNTGAGPITIAYGDAVTDPGGGEQTDVKPSDGSKIGHA